MGSKFGSGVARARRSRVPVARCTRSTPFVLTIARGARGHCLTRHHAHALLVIDYTIVSFGEFFIIRHHTSGHSGEPLGHLRSSCFIWHSHAHAGRRPSPLAVRRRLLSFCRHSGHGGAHARLEGVGASSPVADPPRAASASLARCLHLWLSPPLVHSRPALPPRLDEKFNPTRKPSSRRHGR